jgi:hypothetical protein
MSESARKLAHPGAARRAAEILVNVTRGSELTASGIDSSARSRNNS